VTDGTCLPRFKVAFISKMATAGIANTFYESPMQPDDILGSDGSGVAGWFLDEASANLQITVVASPQIWIDETWTVPFVVQALGVDTDSNQQAVDQLASTRLGAILGAWTDPSFGITDDTHVQVFTALPVGANAWHGGVLPPNLRGCGFQLDIEVHARLMIGT